jgi:hypothetical protein
MPAISDYNVLPDIGRMTARLPWHERTICLLAPIPAAFAAAMYTLTETAKMNGINPEGYLRDVLARITDHPINRIGELLPWNWRPSG